MKLLIKNLCVVLAFFPMLCFSGHQTGTVDTIIVRASDGLVYFTLSGPIKTNPPACATIGYWMIKDENSNAGKLQYSMVLAAQASGKKIKVTGSGTCGRWKDGEDVDVIQLFPT